MIATALGAHKAMLGARELARSGSESGMLWLPLAEAVNRGARFAVTVLLARSLGPAAYGDWLIAAALGMMLTGGGDLGLSTVITRRVAANRLLAPSYLSCVLGIVPVLTVTIIAALAVTQVFLDATARTILLLLGIGGMLECMALLALSPMRGHGRVAPESYLRAFQGIALLSGATLLLAAGAGALGYAVLLAVVGAASLGLAVTIDLSNFGLVRPTFDARAIASLLPESLPVFLSVTVVLVYFRIDLFLIAALRDSATTGVYGAAYGIAFGLTFVPLMFGRALLPRFASKADASALRETFGRALRNVVLVACVSTLALLAAIPALGVLYGDSYSGLYAPYALLTVAQALFYLTHVHYIVLLARSRTGVVWLLTVGTLILNVGANLVLIPSFGASGAALAAVASEAGLLIAQALIVRRMLREVTNEVAPYIEAVSPA